MGSVAKRTCARGHRCYHFPTLDDPQPLGSYRLGNLCERCEQLHGGAVRASSHAAWLRQTLSVIELVVSQERYGEHAFEASLWDLMEMPTPHLAREGETVHLGAVVRHLSPGTLRRVAMWLYSGREEAISRYGPHEWGDRYAYIATVAWVKQRIERCPARAPLLGPRQEGDRPVRAVVVSPGGKKRDLLLPFRVRQLRRQQQHFSERDIALRLNVARSRLKRMLDRARHQDFSLDEPLRDLPLDVLGEIVGAGKRGPKKRRD